MPLLAATGLLSPHSYGFTTGPNFSVLIVGGGGGSSRLSATGSAPGGAGGIIYSDSLAPSSGTYTITVGGGGSGVGTPTSGSSSSAFSLTAGGGGGGGYTGSGNGLAGNASNGSGGAALGDRLRLPQMAAQETEQAMRAAVETLTQQTQAQAVVAVQDRQAQHLAFTA